jgi:hypothetical protein
MSEITACTTVSELSRVITKRASDLDGAHDSAVCVQCWRLDNKSAQELRGARELWGKAAGRWLRRAEGGFGCEGRNAANILHAAGKLGVTNTAQVRALVDAAVRLAPTFNAQEAANSLWAAASLGLFDASVVAPLAAATARLAHGFQLSHADSVLQAHYAGAPVDAACLSVCWRLFRASPRPPTTSDLQARVAHSLRAMGLRVELEVPILEGLRMLDIVVTTPGEGARVAVEVDGPSHFFAPPLGGGAPRPRPTRLRDRHIAAAGYSAAFSISYLEFGGIGEAERHALLGSRLKAALLRAQSAGAPQK